MDKSLGTLLHFQDIFQFTRAQPVLSSQKQGWMYVSKIFNFVWVGGGTNEENFEKVALFYEGTQILQKITNTALLSQGLLSRIVGTINYFLE